MNEPLLIITRHNSRPIFQILILVTIFCLYRPILANGEEVSVNLPRGIEVKQEFEPGFGKSVGSVKAVKGQAYVIHSKKNAAFPLKQQDGLYLQDILITGKKSGLRMELSDKSVLSLASQTKLKLNRNVYEPEERSRSSFIRMFLGKARFLIKKMVDYKKSEFKVKTNTAIAGVRGSDFIVQAEAQETTVTALEDTKLQIVSPAFPEDPLELTDREQTHIRKGNKPEPVKKVSRETIEQLKESIPLGTSQKGEGAKDGGHKKETGDKESDSAGTSQKDKVYFSEEHDAAVPEQSQEQVPPDLEVKIDDPHRGADRMRNTQEAINEDIKEEEIRKLPGFPGHPAN